MIKEDINKINDQFINLGLPSVIKEDGDLTKFGLILLVGLGISIVKEFFRLFASIIKKP